LPKPESLTQYKNCKQDSLESVFRLVQHFQELNAYFNSIKEPTTNEKVLCTVGFLDCYSELMLILG